MVRSQHSDNVELNVLYLADFKGEVCGLTYHDSVIVRVQEALTREISHQVHSRSGYNLGSTLNNHNQR